MEQLADNLWVHEWAPRVAVTSRMVVIRLDDGGLWVHSAATLTAELVAELAVLGPVKHVVIPSLWHDIGGPAAATHYGCDLYAAPGWPAANPAASVVAELGDDAPAAWAGQIDQVFIRGADRASETVFLHRASKTLILTDLAFNVRAGESPSYFFAAVMWLVGAYGRYVQSKSWRYWFTTDHGAAAASVQRVLDWDFERVVMGHGTVVDVDAKARTAAALEWMASGP